MATRKGGRRRESRDRGMAALVVSVCAITIVLGTGLYVHHGISKGHEIHIGLHVALAIVAAPLLALWLVWDWISYRRGMPVAVPKLGQKSRGRKKKRTR